MSTLPVSVTSYLPRNPLIIQTVGFSIRGFAFGISVGGAFEVPLRGSCSGETFAILGILKLLGDFSS